MVAAEAVMVAVEAAVETPARPYTVTVTGTSGSASQMTTVTLTVN
jgi:hypothetical protein